MNIIQIPTNIYSDYKGYDLLVEIFYQFNKISYGEIRFDFQKCDFFAGNLCALLGGIVEYIRNNNNTVYFDNLNNRVTNFFKKNGFWRVIDTSFNKKHHKNCIPFKHFNPEDDGIFDLYLEEKVFSLKQIPQMDLRLKNVIEESLNELFINACEHSSSNVGIFTCGQVYQCKPIPKITFTIVDMGVGFAGSYNRKYSNKKNGEEAIKWATKKGSTTKNHPGGLGLDIIRKFINLNKGHINIYSNDGFWEYRNNEENSKSCKYCLIGTMINIEIIIDNGSIYLLK